MSSIIMTPLSIQSKETLTLEKTWVKRLEGLDTGQLLIDMEQMSDPMQIDMLLEQFGVPYGLFDFSDFSPIERADFLRRIMKIYRLSGTKVSIVEMAKALGATRVSISTSWLLKYNGQARYNGLHRYDTGTEHKRQAVTVNVKGVSDINIFGSRFRLAWKVFQPIKLFLEKIVFT